MLMAYAVMAYMVMTYIITAYVVMGYIVLAYMAVATHSSMAQCEQVPGRPHANTHAVVATHTSTHTSVPVARHKSTRMSPHTPMRGILVIMS